MKTSRTGEWMLFAICMFAVGSAVGYRLGESDTTCEDPHAARLYAKSSAKAVAESQRAREGQQILRLLELPLHEWWTTTHPTPSGPLTLVWAKTGAHTLLYRPIPTGGQAKIVQMFGAPTDTTEPAPTTTTTVLPSPPSRGSKKETSP